MFNKITLRRLSRERHQKLAQVCINGNFTVFKRDISETEMFKSQTYFLFNVILPTVSTLFETSSFGQNHLTCYFHRPLVYTPLTTQGWVLGYDDLVYLSAMYVVIMVSHVCFQRSRGVYKGFEGKPKNK